MPFSSALLNLLAFIYGIAINIRNKLYDFCILKVHKVPPVVVSVGNIEAGGTGKTPFTMAIAEKLIKDGYKVAIVTRGYKGTLKGPVLVEKHHTSSEVGDEALLMSRLTGIPVIKSPERVSGALFAHKNLSSEIIVLDDGFQHRRLHRDIDIVLISRDISQEKLLPAGMLREPASSLKRADFIVSMKGANHNELKAELKPECLVDLKGNKQDLTLLKGKRVLAFCAIARPEHFIAMLEGLGSYADRLIFKDHHPYSTEDAKTIMDRSTGKDLILTTEKDLVKIDPSWFKGMEHKLFAVHAGIEMPGMTGVINAIERLGKTRSLSR